MSFIIIYVTHPNKEEAERIALYLLENKMITCVNYLPIESTYWWKGKLENSHEIVTLLKTKKDNWDKVKSEIEKIHPYETPCIIKFDVEANDSYESWIKSETI